MTGVAHPESQNVLDYAYGELSPDAQKSFESHLRTCPDCTQALGEIRGVRRTMAQWKEEPAPQEGMASLMAYAQKAAQRAEAEAYEQAPPRPAWWKWAAPLLATATAIVIGGIAQRVMRDVPYSDEEVIRHSQTGASSFSQIEADEPSEPVASAQPDVVAKEDGESAPVEIQAKVESKSRQERPAKTVAPKAAERNGDEDAQEFRRGAGAGVAAPPAAAPAPTPNIKKGVSRLAQPSSLAPEGTAAGSAASAGAADSAAIIPNTETLGSIEASSSKRLDALKAAAARTPHSAALEKVLVEWCDLEWALGRRHEAQQPCERLLKEFPRSAHASRIRDRSAR